VKQLHVFSTAGFTPVFIQLLRRFNCYNSCEIIQLRRDSYLGKVAILDEQGGERAGGAPNLYAYDKVVVHFLSPTVCEWIVRHPKVSFTWVLYGADLYSNPLVPVSFLLPASADFEKKNPIEFLRRTAYKVLKSKDWNAALLQVGTLLTSSKAEYDQVKSMINIPNARWGKFYYGKALIDYAAVETRSSRDGPLKMMLGNNATSSLNHADFLLSQPDNPNQVQWHIPLSYGSTRYSSWLQAQVGHRKDVVLHLEHRPFDAYTEWLSGLHGAVFHNIRPQGLANLHSLVMMGKAVFLHEKNSLRDHYVQSGLFLPCTKDFMALKPQVALAQPWSGNKIALQSFWNIEDCMANYQEHFS